MKNPVLRYLLSPLSFVYVFLMLMRNILYSTGFLKARRVKAKVISVGNLTTGGTGKTPLVIELVRRARSRGIPVAVVSRGYGREGSAETDVVDPDAPEAARIYGDEPVLIARESGVPVYVGADRVRVSNFALERSEKAGRPLSLIILDDGFQHRRLYRNADVVVLDTSAPFWHELPLPSGRAREGFGSLLRADLVVLNKINLSQPVRLQWLLSRVPPNVPRVSCGYRLDGFFDLRTGDRQPAPPRVFAVAAIARPETFHELLRTTVTQVTGHLSKADHHLWNEDDLSQARASAGGSVVVVTEKDAVKMRALKGIDGILVAKLSLAVLEGEEKLDELLDQALL